MPRYDFECKKCKSVYDEMTPFDKTGKYSKVVCPECGSKSKTKLMTTCGYAFANPVGTDRYNSESGGHQFRFQHKLPSVIAERQAAEMAGGTAQPYNPINDLESDASWGEAK
jgi:putative FmdB family regulatory protein